MKNKDLPKGYIPSVKDVEWFIDYWKKLPNYSNQERALDKLFMDICKHNDCIEDILIKCSSLNDFYSTNIFDIHTLAQHILSLNIDDRLKNGDLSLVDDIAHVNVNGKDHFFYSFATKYCSHHQPVRYAIYDNYVEKVLVSMNNHFTKFKREDLKDYNTYINIIKAFQQHYGLMQYSFKQLDHYLWQLGKWYFNQFGLCYKYYNREDESPYTHDDIRSKFWDGEMNFVMSHQNVGKWKQEGKEWLKTANEQIKQLARKYSPEQFGVITYISLLYGRHCPYDAQEWILEY